MSDASGTARDAARPSDDGGSVVALPRRGAPAALDNLPLELSSFVGRAREMAEVRRLLAANRLLTLTGPGGSGKTRLALATAADMSGRFGEGVWLVELAPLSNPEDVGQTFASVLGVQEEPGRPLTETLADEVRSQEMLLVLDNCEHLVEAAASLASVLLGRCPNLRVLATSREALGVTGETLFAVSPLSLPDPHLLPAADALADYEAARLFVERARAIRPGFKITDRIAVAIAQICYRLDGMPLAIELAAARAKVLSVEQISGRLEKALGLLSSGGRTEMAHHRTLRATMDWSHELLPEEERVLLRRLSVFAGGFTLNGAEAVCAGEVLALEEVLEFLSQLVDKSLVMVEEREGEVRYRLLETVRQYGMEKLEGSGEAEMVLERHARYFLALAEEAESELMGTHQEAWLGRLEAEHDNLRAVLARALENGEADLGLRVAGVLGGFWLVRGRLSEGRRWLEAALQGGVVAPELARTRALLLVGLIAREQGDHERSVELIEEALALARKLGDKATAASALLNLGWAALLRDELRMAGVLTQESLTLQREMNNQGGVARALTVLGLLASARGDHKRAMALHEEGLGLSREAREAGGIVVSLMQGAIASLGRGDHRRAGELCEEGLESSWRLKMVHPTASHLPGYERA